jgi:Zn-dependent protease
LGGIDLTEVLIVLVVLIASLSVHEAAHAFAADRLGDPTARQLGRLSLNPAVHIDPIGTLLFPLIAYLTGVPLIGWAKPVPVNPRLLKHPKRDFALIAAAGPASNLVMAAIGAVALSAARNAAGPGDIVGGALTGPLMALLFTFAIVNVLLAVFNMIPVPPLDGGNVLLGLLPAAPARLIEQMRPYGILILYALMLTGVLNTLLGPVVGYLRYVLGV